MCRSPQRGSDAYDPPQVGGTPSREKNAARIRHDRTPEVACGVVMARMKEGKQRFCNAGTMKDAYAIARLDDSLCKLEDAKTPSFSTTLDLCSAELGYYQ